MDSSANVNALDGHGQTPLIRAVQNRNERIIDSLLSHGAHATISTSRGATPLILLADPIPQDEGNQDWDKDARIAKKMMDANVNVNAVDDGGLSALHWAAQSGHGPLASVLLNEGEANFDIQNQDGQTALSMTTIHLLSKTILLKLKRHVSTKYWIH
jgi:ankyrin repeat protein